MADYWLKTFANYENNLKNQQELKTPTLPTKQQELDSLYKEPEHHLSPKALADLELRIKLNAEKYKNRIYKYQFEVKHSMQWLAYKMFGRPFFPESLPKGFE